MDNLILNKENPIQDIKNVEKEKEDKLNFDNNETKKDSIKIIIEEKRDKNKKKEKKKKNKDINENE